MNLSFLYFLPILLVFLASSHSTHIPRQSTSKSEKQSCRSSALKQTFHATISSITKPIQEKISAFQVIKELIPHLTGEIFAQQTTFYVVCVPYANFTQKIFIVGDNDHSTWVIAQNFDHMFSSFKIKVISNLV